MTGPIDYQAVLMDLRARRRQLDAAIASIESILTAAGVAVEADERDAEPAYAEPSVPAINAATRRPASAQAGGAIENDTFFGLSTPEAIKKYLNMVKRPQKLPAIASALLQGGQIHAVDATTAYNNVYAAIKRMEKAGEAVKIKTGDWGLAEWYGSSRPKSEVE